MTTLLPKIDVPTYTLKIPSNGQEITVRPFLVKEEKLLLMSAESGNTQDIVNTVKQVIQNCIIDDDFDINGLPFFDIDYIFIMLRAKSIGENIELKISCRKEQEDGNICGNVFFEDIDATSATIVFDPDITRDIKLSNKITLKMKYPSYTIMKLIDENESAIERKITIMANCIEFIIDGDKAHSYKDYTMDQLKEFVEGLTESQFKIVEKFIDNFPHFAVVLDTVCDKCGSEHHLEYTDFTSFF